MIQIIFAEKREPGKDADGNYEGLDPSIEQEKQDTEEWRKCELFFTFLRLILIYI